MSEETQEVAIVVVGATTSGSNVQFADGIHNIPAHVIEELGGPEQLDQLAPGLEAVTFTQFMDGLHAVRAKRMVNTFQANFVGNHFKPGPFGR